MLSVCILSSSLLGLRSDMFNIRGRQSMASAAGSVRTSKTRQTQAISLDSITIEAARCTKDLHEAATFFVDAFWGDSTSSSKSLELSPQGRAAMIGEQCEDMEERYGELVGSRRLQSKLLIARDPNGEIAGCIGVELAVMSVVDKTVLPRREGEQIFKREFDAMSGRERKQYRNMPLQELAAQILEPGYGVCPLIANLAVGTDYRGSGLSRELCFRVEDLVDASGWGYGGIVLQVEKNNKPAVALYGSLGYDELFSNENWPALRVRTNGEFTTETVKLLTLTKAL